jgi:hypothetical protein
MSAEPEDQPLPPQQAPPIDKPQPRAKRAMTEAQLENLRKAREKALATRQDKKLLLEREELMKKEALEARWEALHAEEERLKSLRKAPEPPPPKKKEKVSKKSKIIHVSPPLSSEPSSPDPSSDSSMEFVPKASRRAHRISQKQNQIAETPMLPVPRQNPPPPQQAPSQDEQLKIALRALGLSG